MSKYLDARLVELLVTIVCAIVASNGFWTYIQARKLKKSIPTEMLIGLGYDHIVSKAMEYIGRGYITKEEYEVLNHYLYEPYVKLGGDGTVKRLMEEVKKLPIRDSRYVETEDDGNE